MPFADAIAGLAEPFQRGLAGGNRITDLADDVQFERVFAPCCRQLSRALRVDELDERLPRLGRLAMRPDCDRLLCRCRSQRQDQVGVAGPDRMVEFAGRRRTGLLEEIERCLLYTSPSPRDS